MTFVVILLCKKFRFMTEMHYTNYALFMNMIMQIAISNFLLPV